MDTTTLSHRLSSIFVSSAEKKVYNPDILLSGTNFLRGSQYREASALPAELPEKKPAEKRIRYFDSSAPVDVPTPSERTDASPLPRELLRVVCMDCGKLGHVHCASAAEDSTIVWKPVHDYQQLMEHEKDAQIEEIREKRADKADDMEINLAFHLRGICGARKKANAEANVEMRYRKYKARLRKCDKIYCCFCGDHHKLSECPEYMIRHNGHRGFEKLKIINKAPSPADSDTTASLPEDSSLEQYIVEAFKKHTPVFVRFKRNKPVVKKLGKVGKAKRRSNVQRKAQVAPPPKSRRSGIKKWGRGNSRHRSHYASG